MSVPSTELAVQRYRALIFDLDGVLWVGKNAIPGVAERVNQLRSGGHAIRFLTNNSGQARTTIVERLENIGVVAAPDDVVTAGSATALHLRKHFGALKTHVMGSPGLAAELELAGHTVVECGAEAVVVGLDHTHTWAKLDAAFQNLRNPACKFIACNNDYVYPDHKGIRPGTGANVAALAHCARRQPDVIVGKPERHIMDIVIDTLGLAPAEILMVGDRLESDILGGQQVGIDTLYVLSGAGKLEAIEAEGIFPTYVLPSVADIP